MGIKTIKGQIFLPQMNPDKHMPLINKNLRKERFYRSGGYSPVFLATFGKGDR
jgi:hypothetical protein